jgi:hypothetical protein
MKLGVRILRMFLLSVTREAVVGRPMQCRREGVYNPPPFSSSFSLHTKLNFFTPKSAVVEHGDLLLALLKNEQS